MVTVDEVQTLIAEECNRVLRRLQQKTIQYGNSAIAPRRVLSSLTSTEQLAVRFDDKIALLQTARENGTLNLETMENVIVDVAGIAVLLAVAQRVEEVTAVKRLESDLRDIAPSKPRGRANQRAKKAPAKKTSRRRKASRRR